MPDMSATIDSNSPSEASYLQIGREYQVKRSGGQGDTFTAWYIGLTHVKSLTGFGQSDVGRVEMHTFVRKSAEGIEAYFSKPSKEPATSKKTLNGTTAEPAVLKVRSRLHQTALDKEYLSRRLNDVLASQPTE